MFAKYLGKVVSFKVLFIFAAKLTGKQAFVSYDLPQDRMLLPLVETRIISEIKTSPEKFYF